MEAPTRTPPQSPLTKGSQHRKSGKSRTIKAPAASREENSKVILRGWLQKQESGGLKLWKKKWSVLADFGLFFYKDDSEQNCIGSILLPSYKINPCSSHDVNKKYAFKAEHENMKTFYFAAENQVEMEKWVEALKMASLVQRAPGSGLVPKMIPKSPIMSWNDDTDSPGISPPDMQQYPFSGQDGNTTRGSGDNSFIERAPLQARENIQNYSDPYQRHRNGSGPSSVSSGTLPRDNRGQGPGPGYGQPNYPDDPRYLGDRTDRKRSSQRSNQGQGLPDDQRSMSSVGQRSAQYPSSTMPRDMRPNQPDNRSLSSLRGQGYNSLPRDQRSRPQEGHELPHRTKEYRENPKDASRRRRDDNNPYMTMMSPHANERKMDPLKHSNRPLPQEPRHERPRNLEPAHEKGRSGGGDYASLTRIRDKWPNQQLSDSGTTGSGSESNRPNHHLSPTGSSGEPVRPNHLSPTQQNRPDLYVDIPHTYVNVYDESQVRDHPPELPSRPPLPAEMRHQIVEDIAKTRSPNTQNEMIIAENNLERRMNQPAFFNYPTPTQESLPSFPQESPRSQYSQRSQRSQDPRSYEQDRGQPHLPRRPDIAHDAPITRQDARNSYQPPPNKYGHNLNDSNLSNHLDGSDITLTNEDERNDKISEFYGLGKYNAKKGQNRNDKTRFMSDIDVRSNTVPYKPQTGITGEKDFRLRSLPDHVQSMPALYHEQQPLSIQVPEREPVNSYMNLSAASSIPNGHEPADQDQRRSAFRPLSANSLQRIPSTGSYPDDRYGDYRDQSHREDYPNQGRSGDYNMSPNYSDQGRFNDYNTPQQDQTDVKRLSSASSQLSQNRIPPWKQDTLQGDHDPGRQNRGQGYKGQGQRGHRPPPAIHTVKEDPDMPDSQVIETELPKKVFPLNGPRLRMSISATDLLGKTHDELVLLLIQLRRDKAELNEQRDGIRKNVEQNRPAEFYYRKLQNEGRPIDGEKELQHRRYVDLKHKLDEVEKKLEVYKPLVNLVCNMVTMGSLYGGDNLMLATEYRKHLLSPEQYSPPKKMLEFSRKHQEDQVIQGIEEDVKQLTQEQADLEEKLNRLYDLDKVIQDQSFQVTSLKEDREMLERALGGLLKKQDQHCTNQYELNKLLQQQKTIEKELSRVLQQLAEASKELEETTAENNKLEHEVALLRSKVHGNVSRSKSAPSLSSESLRTKMKMEKDLAKVKNIMAGLSQEGARLQEMMSTLRKPKSATEPQSPPFQQGRLPGTDQRDGRKLDTRKQDGRKQDGSTYYETDLDNGQSKDLAQVTALLASYHLLPEQPMEDISHEAPTTRSEVGRSFGSPPPSTEEGTSAFRTVSPSRKEDDTTYHASLVQATFQPNTQSQLESGMETDGSPDQWDIGEADDNTKRFFGLIPKSMPKQQTVRDVKRISETRKEVKKREDSPPLRVGVIPSDYNDNTHVYENLPQQKSSSSTEEKLPWAALVKDDGAASGTPRRRSNLHLMAPKPFSLNSKPTPYSSVNNISMYNSQNLDQSDAPLHNNHNTQDSQSHSISDNLNTFENNQSNDSYKPTEPMATQLSNKTPPPPPVRGTSKYIADVPNLERFQEMLKKSSSNRNYEIPVPAILKKGRNARNSQKGRYLTISSSEPIKLEQNISQSPKLHSQAGDLITSMDIPDIVKSSTTKSDLYDERTIEREILYFPEKVEIPERYIPDSDDESVTEEEKASRREKANKIKKILTQQSVHSLSQPDVSKVAGEVHERVQHEKQQRALLLGINQELAEQVKKKSRQYAAERRKTWSGTTQKVDVEPDHHAETDDEHHGDANNNSYTARDDKEVYYTEKSSYDTDLYHSDLYTSPRQYDDAPNYYNANYNTTSYDNRPNFKI
ncbi:uncharacterized protein LOC132724715 isoform X3 [Ruditapes philippinarum]|nr:uncharacterized protein LOC132724715 isoform X3 [Ruditapes philippinarum]